MLKVLKIKNYTLDEVRPSQVETVYVPYFGVDAVLGESEYSEDDLLEPAVLTKVDNFWVISLVLNEVVINYIHI